MSPTIHLLTAGTPNGHKVSILLEELGLEYKTTAISFDKKDQKTPEFLKVNPNGRIPAIEDLSTSPPTPMFESGSIMLYLVEKYDATKKVSFEHGSPEYWQCLNWIMFQMAGQGPMQGQLNHFHRYAPEKIPYAVDRYHNETRRLYGVLDQRLQETGDYLVGHKYSIADMINWTWVNFAFWAGIDTSEFPALEKWFNTIDAREATKAGLNVPTEFTLKKKYLADPKSVDDYAKKSSQWIIDGQKEDAQKNKK